MASAKINTRNGGIVGIFVGLFFSALSNGWLTVSANPIAGQGIAQGYVFILPAISTIFTLLSLFTNKVKLGTKMGGFLIGFSGITLIISIAVFTVPTMVHDIFTYIVK